MVKNSQMIMAGQSAISILPKDAQLMACIMVDTRAIGFIEPGQRVVLRYQAFPYQKFGQQYGKVVEVSRTALSPQEIANLTGKNNIQEQQYRILVQLDRQSISVYSRREPLRPGMAPRLSVYMNYLVDNTNKNIAIQKLSIMFGTTLGLISSIGRVVLIWLAARQVLESNFSAGMLTAFVSFSDQFIGRASVLINALIDFRMLRMHGERLSDIVLAEIEPEQDEARPVIGQDSSMIGDITLRGLKFRYAETEPWVINGIDLTIKAGRSVAIVGSSGQGKTTLAKIILGLLHPEEGTILVDGHEIAKTGLQHHRERIGCVMQDDILFSGSIAENISFFDSEMDMEKGVRVARAAQIHDDIMNIPMNYYSLIGDMGSFLSGGQQQRVLLARALYRDPKILVLDEATITLT